MYRIQHIAQIKRVLLFKSRAKRFAAGHQAKNLTASLTVARASITTYLSFSLSLLSPRDTLLLLKGPHDVQDYPPQSHFPRMEVHFTSMK